jgi:hypothetical protein
MNNKPDTDFDNCTTTDLKIPEPWIYDPTCITISSAPVFGGPDLKVLDLRNEDDRSALRQAVEGEGSERAYGYIIDGSDIRFSKALFGSRHRWTIGLFSPISPEEAFNKLPPEQKEAMLYDMDLFVRETEPFDWDDFLQKSFVSSFRPIFSTSEYNDIIKLEEFDMIKYKDNCLDIEANLPDDLASKLAEYLAESNNSAG